MDSHYFVGCPYYKDDIAQTLHERYPHTSVSEFKRKPMRQLRIMYAETVKRDTKKGVMQREKSRESAGKI